MKLSVVIPTHNKQPLLARTLAALQKQDVGEEAWEIVVVDDGSSDNTGSFLAELAVLDLRLSVVSPPWNVGRAAARNLGWQAARGDSVLFMDDDILAPAGLLKAHLELLDRGREVGTIGPAVTDPAIIDGPHFHYIDSRGVAKLKAGPAPGKYFVTQNAAVPRWALEALGGFDEAFSAYGFEDMDIGFRLEDAGVRFHVLPTPVPLHIHHHTLDDYLEKKSVISKEDEKKFMIQRAEKRSKSEGDNFTQFKKTGLYNNKSLKVRLYDLSPNGMSFLVTNPEGYEVEENINILFINQKAFDPPLKGEIRSVREMDDGHFKIGIQFKTQSIKKSA